MHHQSASAHALQLGYTLDEHDIIRSPGKFEAEPAYLLHFWHVMLDGGSDETLYDDDDAAVDLFLLTDEDRQYIGQPDAHALILGETGQGFAMHQVLTLAEYQVWRAHMDGND